MRTPGSMAEAVMESFARNHSLARLCRRLAGQRRHPQGGDAIAGFTQDLKTETMKREALSGFGDRTCLVNDNAGDRGGLVVRNIPIHCPIEIANRYAAV